MIEMRVMGIALDTRSGSPIVVLNDKDNKWYNLEKAFKILSVWSLTPQPIHFLCLVFLK